MATIKEYWDQWLWRDTTSRLITVNTAVWIVIACVSLGIGSKAATLEWWIGLFALPAALPELAWRPWTVLTYMVSQHDFLHLLVNMLWLLLFGRMIEHALGGRRLLEVYVYGGIAGAVAFVVANIVHPGPHPFMIGASCAVLGVIGTAAVMMPRWRVPLLVFGDIKVAWIAVTAIVLFVILEPSLYVSISHTAGLAMGLLYGVAKRNGGLLRLVGLRKLRLPNLRGFDSPIDTGTDEDNLDALLAKVGRSGYASLSARERQKLFDLSQKIKR